MEEKEAIETFLARVKNWVDLYKIPLIFGSIGIICLIAEVIIWQSSNRSATINFTQEKSENLSSGQKDKIKVDLEGAVSKPGVYELLSGSRMQDLLNMAGGLAVDADRDWASKNLNLAQKLSDGGKVYVPKRGEVKSGKAEGGETQVSEKINVNNASLAELDKLPGIGPQTGQQIITGRPYQTVEELLSKKIVGKATFDKIKEQITAF